MSDTCHNCKHWTPDEVFLYDGYGYCGRAFIDSSVADTPRQRYDRIITFEGIKLTGRDFGCIHWRGRQPLTLTDRGDGYGVMPND